MGQVVNGGFSLDNVGQSEAPTPEPAVTMQHTGRPEPAAVNCGFDPAAASGNAARARAERERVANEARVQAETLIRDAVQLEAEAARLQLVAQTRQVEGGKKEAVERARAESEQVAEQARQKRAEAARLLELAGGAGPAQ